MTLASALGVLAFMSCNNGPDEEAYVYRNARLVDEIPTYPGAKLFTSEEFPYTGDDESQIEGWKTMLVYTLPDGTADRDLVTFFEDQFRDEWQYCASGISFTRNNELVSLGPVSEAGFYGVYPPGYSMFVDYAGADTAICADDPAPSNHN